MKKTAVVILLSLNLLPLSLLAIRADFQFTRVCVGTETELVSTTTPDSSIYRLMWDLDGDGIFDDAIGETVKILFSYAGAYNIGLKAIAINGDQDAIYKSVPVASLQVAFLQDYSCLNLPVHFYDETIILEDTASQYIWDFGDGSPGSYQSNPTHNYTLAGEYLVRLVVSTTAGCIDSAENSITILNPPVVDISFSGDTVFPEGDSVIATIVGVYDSVFWNTGEETNSIVIYETGYYFVRGYLNGCYGEKFFSVTSVVDTIVRIMTVITPNQDGFNDRWEIINLPEIEPCNVEIYNRWGQKVFSASPYSNDWDGTENGKQLSNDTYYYFLRCKDGNLQTGTISIVR
ncbi:MAG: gliding motility-associated C-terminal domain-containing protein [Bacteroidales bacterium]|nr:gliding motility-associated C-terminal domain-containing protein [Bacteroidales bacterium]